MEQTIWKRKKIIDKINTTQQYGVEDSRVGNEEKKKMAHTCPKDGQQQIAKNVPYTNQEIQPLIGGKTVWTSSSQKTWKHEV